MDLIEKAHSVLLDAETALRALIEQGLREQRYEQVAEVAVVAAGLSRLIGGGREAEKAHATGVPSSRAQESGRLRPAVKAPRDKAPTLASYPRFERDGNRLVKIGWSKKNKAAYEHRAGREVVSAFVRHLLGTVAEGKVFMVEALMPVADITNGGEIPAYQIYVTLAWLRQAGVIKKKGRDGYLYRRADLADARLDQLWTALPTRSTD